MHTVVSWLLGYAFYYPLVMSFIWMSGGLIYFLRRERNQPSRVQPPELESYPFVTLIVPCHNEGKQVRETIAYLHAQRYPGHGGAARIADNGGISLSPALSGTDGFYFHALRRAA